MTAKNKQSIGILDQGKDTKVINSEFINLDVGIKAEGEGLEARGNKHIDFRHKQTKYWYEKWWVKYLLLPLSVLVIGTFIIFKLGWS